MRISLVGPVYPYRGGISHYTALLARALKERGHTVQVISFKRQYPAFLYPGETDRDPSKNPIRTEADFVLDPLYPWTWAAAVRRVSAFQPDLIAVQWWTTFWGPAFAVLARLLKRQPAPLVFMIHNVLPHEQRPWDRPLALAALSQGDCFIAQTRRERERLLALLPAAHVISCPLPAYTLLARAGLSHDEARHQLHLNPEAFLLLFFGFVRPYKGVHVLLQALERLRSQGRRPHLAIVGEFWQDKAEYLAEIEQFQLADQIRIEDRYVPDEEIGPWFSAADCLVAPYTAGTQSAAAGIALAYGLPMIASEQVVEGIATENRAAVIGTAPPGDAEKLAEAIAAAMERERSAVREPIHAIDGWPQMVDVFEKIARGDVTP